MVLETRHLSEHDLARLSAGLEIVALRILGDRDQAQDAAQETLARLMAALETKGIPEAYTLASYAFGTLKHVIAGELRSRKRTFRLAEWLRSAITSPLEQLVDTERAVTVAQALGQLDPADRELLQRCYYHSERVVDIAARTGEPAERIRKRKSRALEKLRAVLRARGHVSSSMDD